MLLIFNIEYAWLVGGFNPSEKHESQLGMMKIPIYGNITIHEPNHQPDEYIINVWQFLKYYHCKNSAGYE